MGEIEAAETPETDAARLAPPPPRTGRVVAVATLVAAAVVGVPLAAVAVTGGLADRAGAGPAEIGVRESVVAAEQRLSVAKVAVVDTLMGGGTFPDEDEGERVLAVLLDVTNLDEVPRGTSGFGTVGAIRLEGRPDDRPTVSVYGDDDFSPVTLQPDVPVRLLLTWTASRGEVADGDEVRIVLPDAETFDSLLFSGEVSWSELPPSAIVTARVEDLGDGGEDGRL